MTSTVVDPFGKTALRHPQWKSVLAGQVVAAEAAAALLLAAMGRGPVLFGAACVAGAVVVTVAFARVRGRWLFDWLVVGVRYGTRRRTLPPHSTSVALVRFLAPDLALPDDGGFVDADGLVTVFELDAPVVAVEPAPLPDLTGLIGGDPPVIRVDLLVTATWARVDRTAAAVSYRQSAQDRVLALGRAFVVVRVVRPPGWSDADLRPTMSGVARRVAKRIGPHRRLGHDDALATVAELAHHDGSSGVEEAWSFVAIGGLCQSCYRMTCRGGATSRALRLLLALPATATTVSTSVADSQLSIRLASESPAHLEHADRALRQLAAAEHATVQRLDGDHRASVADTLPFGGHSGSLGLPIRREPIRVPAIRTMLGQPGPLRRGRPDGGPADGAPPRTDPGRPRPSPRPRKGPSARDVVADAGPVGGVLPPAGMVLGYDRHDAPMIARIFRPTGARIVVVGGLRTAQVLALRALALGAWVDVRTRRWAPWNEFAEESGADAIRVTPDAAPLQRLDAGQRYGMKPPPPATPLRPGLTIVDVATRGRRGVAVTNDALGQASVDADQNGAVGHRADPAPVDASKRTETGGPADTTPALGYPGTSSADGGAACRRSNADRKARRWRHVLEVDADEEFSEGFGSDVGQRIAAPDPRTRWRAVVTVRDELTEADVGLLTDADLVVLQTLRPAEAALAADALGYAEAAEWLTRIRAEMVAVVGGGGLRWAVLGTTPVERSLVGSATHWGDPATPNGVDALQAVTRPGNSR